MSIVCTNDLLHGGRDDGYVIAFGPGHDITLGGLRRDAAHNAGLLAVKGVRRAALVCDDAGWFLIGLLALLQIGAEVILPPNSLRGTLSGLESAFDILVTDSPAIEVHPRLILQEGAPIGPIGLITPERARIDFFTSGSTGEMKRVAKTLAQFEYEAAVLERMWGRTFADSRIFATVSHQHVFGMTFRMMWPLLAGRAFAREMHIAWEPLLGTLTAPAAIVTSAAQLTRLGGLPPLDAALRPRAIVTGGAPLPPEAALEADQIFGGMPLEFFGSTEAGAIAWRSGTEDSMHWRPLYGVEVTAGPGDLLQVRTPHAAGEVWCQQADRISLLDDGRFRLEGRADQVVKIEGKRVGLRQLERDIAALPWVDAAAVATLGETRPYLGAVVQLSEAGHNELARLGKFRLERMLRRSLAETQDAAVMPRRWRFVDHLPMDGLGKRRHQDLVVLLEQAP
jgi:acyl-coenzyme A synthetase/AMP-(fatty) acid ligase